MQPTVLFDLDGTLTDPGLGITNSVAYSLQKWGIPVPERRELYCFIGPPLVDSYGKYYGFTRQDAEKAVEDYREYFRDRGIYENQVYDGVPELLASLRRAGWKIVLATSKPEEFAVTILRHFDLERWFDAVAGATMDGSRSKKGDVIAYALGLCGGAEHAVMVGDREHDIKGAKENGIPAIGVLYGYGSREELQQSGAAAIAATPAELLTRLTAFADGGLSAEVF